MRTYQIRTMIQAFGSWTLFWDIYKLFWWFPLGFELLNSNPFGARLQMLSIFFYLPFFQDGRQILETCISWLIDVVESNKISLSVCLWYQAIYFPENYFLQIPKWPPKSKMVAKMSQICIIWHIMVWEVIKCQQIWVTNRNCRKSINFVTLLF